MTIDFHVHLLPDFARNNVTSAAIPDESAHLQHVYNLPITSRLNSLCDPVTYLADADAFKVSRAVVFSYQFQSPDRCKIANQFICQTVLSHPDRFYGLLVAQPRDAQSLFDLEKMLDKPGIVGVKLKPRWGGFSLSDSKLLGPLCDLLLSKNKLLLTHVTQSFHRHTGDQLPDLFSLLRDFPELIVVGAHMAGFADVYNCYPSSERLMRNLYVDISLPSNLRWLPHLMQHGDPSRYLYATDWPYARYSNFERLLSAVPLSEAQSDMLRQGNARNLLSRIGA